MNKWVWLFIHIAPFNICRFYKAQYLKLRELYEIADEAYLFYINGSATSDDLLLYSTTAKNKQ